MLQIRIVTVDSYLAAPITGLDATYSNFQGSVVHQVPVLRIFGITQTGEKACLHVHGVFPYLYVPIPDGIENIDSFMYHLSENLDKQLNIVCNSTYQRQNIFKIMSIKGTPFYGYHSKSHDFLKIFFYKPSNIRKATTILQDGNILGQSFQPHEAHIPYILQFFMDYNLYGMSFLNIEKFTHRKEVSNDETGKSLEKVSTCEIEVDALADDILNISDISSSTMSNPGLVHIWEEERERRRNEELISEPSLQSYENISLICRTNDENEHLIELHGAIKERIRTKLNDNKFLRNDSIAFDASFRESQCTEEQSLLDSQGLEIYNAFKKNLERELLLEQENVPDSDSILGSQRTPLEDTISDNDDDANVDLTQPLCISESDEEEMSTCVIPELNESSNQSETKENRTTLIEFDNSDGEPCTITNNINSKPMTTPRKYKRRSNPCTPDRYKPLEVKVIKSPKSNANNRPILPIEEESTSSQNSPNLNNSFFEKSNLNETLNHLKRSLSQEDSDNLKRHNSRQSNTTSENINTYSHKTVNKQFSARKSLIFDNVPNIEDIPEDCEIIVNSQDSIKSSEKDVFENKLGSENASQEDMFIVTPCSSGTEVKEETKAGCSRRIGAQCFITLFEPPTRDDVIKHLTDYGFNKKIDSLLFYSNTLDDELKDNKKELIQNTSCKHLDEFKSLYSNGLSETQNFLRKIIDNNEQRNVIIQPVKEPPTQVQAQQWLLATVTKNTDVPNVNIAADLQEADDSDDGYSNIFEFSNTTLIEDLNNSAQCISQEVKQTKKNQEQLLHPSPATSRKSASFAIASATPDEEDKICHALQNNLSTSIHKYITLLTMELHIQTRGIYRPDPEHDGINALFYCITNDVPDGNVRDKKIVGIIMVSSDIGSEYPYLLNCSIILVQNEVELLNKFVEIVHYHDPDILAGYEIEMLSWTYIIERAYILGISLHSMLGRLKNYTDTYMEMKLENRENIQLKLPGRIILNIWKLMRHEVALMSYSFENVLYHVLRTRVPHYSFKTLSTWWSTSAAERILTLKYYLTRVEGTVKLLEDVDFIGRTSELATLFGIQFYEVLSRGSQFRVESIMLRMAKPKNYIPVSPSIQQRAAMRAPRWLPLIMEPQSRFYGDPVIVLDFQSLYPSMIIAYNYCFSTCLGFQQNLLEGDDITFGCTKLNIDPKELYRMKGHLHISPAGAVFVDSTIRRGILPQMLEEILETRLMVKNSMKRQKHNKILYQILDARQLGLKLIANVTYGYTSANFSGRMPCVEIGDSVVSKGRETLERAIKLVEQTKRWNAEVVYGDTDSMFVLCRGRTRKEAFHIGQEIANAVTLDNPKPVKLKLEKVYQPCILQTKKRYVGYMYESADQEKPVFNAKGIETVRRDGCPAASKVLEKSLKILFESHDLSKVKSYVNKQLSKIISGSLYLQDLIFAKEYRGIQGYKPGACVPALKLAKEWIIKDRRSEPRIGERVGYVIVCGPPGLPLIQLVTSPHDLLTNPSLKINSEYYITKAILPPLDRCFILCGVNVFSWYKSLPKRKIIKRHINNEIGMKRATLSQYFFMENCIICNQITSSTICSNCQQNKQLLCTVLLTKMNTNERRFTLLTQMCNSCSNRSNEKECDSLDCPIYYSRIQSYHDYNDISNLRNIFNDYFTI